MEWRIGEISNPVVPGFDPAKPWVYEITPVWTSPTLTTFAATISPPATNLAVGKTYRARVRHKNSAGHWSHWSAPLEFTAGAAVPGNLATSLVISEIMYNPPEGSNLEYIELRNISSSSPLVLDGLRFSEGITFSFPVGITLQPGGYTLVVRNRAAFEAKYGTSLPIAGEYLTSSLDNAGETVALSIGVSQVLRTVPYDDIAPWPTAADGSGASLVLIAPHTNPDHALPVNWRAGTATPGFTDALYYTAWKLSNSLTDDGDPDGDCVPNLIEYALGGNPMLPDRTILPSHTIGVDGTWRFTFTRKLLTEDVEWQLQESANLTNWQAAVGASVSIISTTTTTETLEVTVPPTVMNSRFFRFYFQLR